MIELLVGLALALCLAAVAAPLWLSLESAGAREGDRTVQWLQGRVAVARLERDLRLASGDSCLFAVSGPLLEATADQVVFLGRTRPGAAPILVEWELVGGSLMRRWGDCPTARPSSYRHSLYRDHKTMLEGVRPGSVFAYLVDGVATAGPIAQANLESVEAVVLTMRVDVEGERGSVRVATTARVGR
ncbi:MAG: hypothetical protein JXA87_13425 [Thermoleophilia bacterium]|nr:hypothetical protein [Thermoleophilia bacterium]